MTVDDALKLMAALTPIILGILTYFTAKANQHAVHAARNAAAAAEQVSSTLASTTDQTAEKLSTLREGQGEIHTLVNNQLTEAVERLRHAAEEIAELKRLLSECTGRPAPPSPPPWSPPPLSSP